MTRDHLVPIIIPTLRKKGKAAPNLSLSPFYVEYFGLRDEIVALDGIFGLLLFLESPRHPR